MAVAGCSGGGSASVLDTGSISGGAAACRERDILGLFNVYENANVSSALMGQYAARSERCGRRFFFAAEGSLAEKTPSITRFHSQNSTASF